MRRRRRNGEGLGKKKKKTASDAARSRFQRRYGGDRRNVRDQIGELRDIK